MWVEIVCNMLAIEKRIRSLPDRTICNFLNELVKYYLIRDTTTEFT